MLKKSWVFFGVVALIIFSVGPVQATPFTSDLNNPSWQAANGTFVVYSSDHAQLMTSITQVPATLFQAFDSVQPFSLSFWLKWTPSSNLDDFISADLADATNGWSVLLNGPLLDPSDAQLRMGKFFTALLDPAFTGSSLDFNITIVDVDGTADFFDIAFNPAPIPEPSTILLLGIGAVCLCLTRIRQEKNDR